VGAAQKRIGAAEAAVMRASLTSSSLGSVLAGSGATRKLRGRIRPMKAAIKLGVGGEQGRRGGEEADGRDLCGDGASTDAR
jgi:hypothetical protein